MLTGGAVDNRGLEARDDVLVYTSDELAEPLELVGPVEAVVHLESTLDHVDVFVRVCDVHPDGASFNVCDALQRYTPATIDRDADGVFTARVRPLADRPPVRRRVTGSGCRSRAVHTPCTRATSAPVNPRPPRSTWSPTTSPCTTRPAASRRSCSRTLPDPLHAAVDLYWIPLGAGAHVVRISGAAFERCSAFVQRRPVCALYHSALVVARSRGSLRHRAGAGPRRHGERRGVVAEGPVGTRWAGRFRIFRYEIRRWRDGTDPRRRGQRSGARSASRDDVARRATDPRRPARRSPLRSGAATSSTPARCGTRTPSSRGSWRAAASTSTSCSPPSRVAVRPVGTRERSSPPRTTSEASHSCSRDRRWSGSGHGPVRTPGRSGSSCCRGRRRSRRRRPTRTRAATARPP